jgi:hypothetical protein
MVVLRILNENGPDTHAIEVETEEGHARALAACPNTDPTSSPEKVKLQCGGLGRNYLCQELQESQVVAKHISYVSCALW